VKPERQLVGGRTAQGKTIASVETTSRTAGTSTTFVRARRSVTRPSGGKSKRLETSPLLPKQLWTADHHHGYWQNVPWALVNGDALRVLKTLPDDLADCVVTSPPYYWQRDYGVKEQSGQEDTIAEYVSNLTRVFRQVRRVLKPTGVAFLVLGDTYYSGRGRPHGGDPKQIWRGVAREKYRAVDRPGMGLPRKSLIGIPWRVALALQKDGWVLRSAVTWRKPKGLAEPSVRDRPWNASETVFILAKRSNYWFDRRGLGGQEDLWEIYAPNAQRSYRHAAPFPEALVERCLACGCKKGGLVLDPFAGSGTTLTVAVRRGSPAIGVDLNSQYCRLAQRRIIFQKVNR
jgi:DNA modification methylase